LGFCEGLDLAERFELRSDADSRLVSDFTMLPSYALGGLSVESYLQSGLEQRYTADPRGPGVRQSVVCEDLLLFENGIAYRADAAPIGALDSAVNAYGYATVAVADMKELPGRRFGRWKENERARSITIEWFGGRRVKCRRRGNDLVSRSLRATRKATLPGREVPGREDLRPVQLRRAHDGLRCSCAMYSGSLS
jgi:hypothetical protein